MIQELFRLGPLSISPFGVALALAFLAAYWQLAANTGGSFLTPARDWP